MASQALNLMSANLIPLINTSTFCLDVFFSSRFYIASRNPLLINVSTSETPLTAPLYKGDFQVIESQVGPLVQFPLTIVMVQKISKSFSPIICCIEQLNPSPTW